MRVPYLALDHERHILGMSPKWFPIARNFAVWGFELCPYHKHPLESTYFRSCFGTCKIPCTEIQKFFNGLRMRTAIHVLHFKNAQNRCRISDRKCALYWWQKPKHVLASAGGTPGAISPIFCVSKYTPWPLTYIPGFIIPDQFSFDRLTRSNRKTPP